MPWSKVTAIKDEDGLYLRSFNKWHENGNKGPSPVPDTTELITENGRAYLDEDSLLFEIGGDGSQFYRAGEMVAFYLHDCDVYEKDPSTGEPELPELELWFDEHNQIVGTRRYGIHVDWLEHPRSDDPVRDAAFITAHASSQVAKAATASADATAAAINRATDYITTAMNEAFFSISERASWDRVGPFDRIAAQLGQICERLPAAPDSEAPQAT